MSRVKDQYEAYPYPERNPSEEKKRLITGSPSHPLEVDHFIFGGRRDWSKPIRILVAGGGTGDALIQLAQVLTSARKPYEITYIDLSTASRDIAEARAKMRGLEGITFITGSLMDAPKHGPFDYIDCCGVLHHLPDPQQGFDALAKALAADGGLGLMVYAPHGRAGVYPLQEAFGRLFQHLDPEKQLAAAQDAFARVPDGHPFKRNPHLGDHEASDAGFYDLLLHSQDRPHTIDALIDTMGKAGLTLAGLPLAHLYDLSRFVSETPEIVDKTQEMALAEKLDGTIKTHVVYARLAAATPPASPGSKASDVPHLKGLDPQALARQVAAKGAITATLNHTKTTVTIPKAAAPILAGINGKRDLGALKKGVGLDDLAWQMMWSPTQTRLCAFGLLLFSQNLT